MFSHIPIPMLVLRTTTIHMCPTTVVGFGAGVDVLRLVISEFAEFSILFTTDEICCKIIDYRAKFAYV